MNLRDLNQVPPNLPVPTDDGAAQHLVGMALPTVRLRSTRGGDLVLSDLDLGTTIFYCYPMTGRPDLPNPEGWDEIPGARGCTPQACSYRDHWGELRGFGVDVYGVSAQSTADQAEAAERLHLPYPLLSDEQGELARALRLPTFGFGGRQLLKRLTLITRAHRIRACFYPVFPSDSDVGLVLGWLREQTT